MIKASFFKLYVIKVLWLLYGWFVLRVLFFQCLIECFILFLRHSFNNVLAILNACSEIVFLSTSVRESVAIVFTGRANPIALVKSPFA